MNRAVQDLYRILAGRVEEMILEGTLAERPPAAGTRRFYFTPNEIDPGPMTGTLYYDDTVTEAWVPIMGAGAFDLTVEEVDGDPTVSDVNRIRFDQEDGFSVTDDGGGQVTIGMECPCEDTCGEVFFVDNLGNRYDDTGALVGSGPEASAIDEAFGYETPDKLKCGPSPDYDALTIGVVDTSGFHGPFWSPGQPSADGTGLKLGGASNDRLLGLEIGMSGAGPAEHLTINFRDPVTFAIIATHDAQFITDWLTAHADSYEYPSFEETSWAYHITRDPEDGSFWINMEENLGVIGFPLAVLPMWNVSATTGELIRTVEIQFNEVSPGFIDRVERMVIGNPPLAVNCGGTGARTAAEALENLGGVPNTRKLIAGAGITLDPPDGILDEDITIGATGVPNAEDIPFTPAGTIAATDVQAAIEEVAAEAGGSTDVQAAGYWSPLANGDPVNPEIIFDSFGQTVAVWSPTP